MKRGLILVSLLIILLLTACRQRLADNISIDEATVTESTAEAISTFPPETTLNTSRTEETETETAPIHTSASDITEEPVPPETNESPAEISKIDINMAEEEAVEVPLETSMPGVTDEAIETQLSAGESGTDLVVLPEPSDSSGNTNLTDDGENAVGVIIDSYTKLLSRSLGSLYECEKGYIYFECTADYLTVNRSSVEHKLVTESGGYNVAEKLGNNALTVDSGWVLRKNPTVMIKCVSSDILGKNVTNTGSAEAVADEIFSRSGLEGAGFIINRNLCLISEELLATDDGCLLAKIYIANAIYPSLFSEVDITAFCEQIREAGGADYTNGIYVYAS